MIPDPAEWLMDDEWRATLMRRPMKAEALAVPDFEARFAAVCDMLMRVVWAEHYRLNPADPQLHTSAPARRAAVLLMHAAGLEPPMADTEAVDLPNDVQAWLNDTYTPEGQAIWLRAFDRADEAHRERMIRLARTPEMGT